MFFVFRSKIDCFLLYNFTAIGYLALVKSLSIFTGLPPLALLSSAASIKAAISKVSSGCTGTTPVSKNLIICSSNGLYPLKVPNVVFDFSPKILPP
ncbi:hypothetical protein D3C87_1589500 [compost metagenome]